MKILSGAQMSRLDRLSVRRHGISPRELMRCAAQACCDEIFSLHLKPAKARVAIICGPGNNGGDGLAIASILRSRGFATRVFFFGKEAALSDAARYFFHQVTDLIRPQRELNRALHGAQVVVDAVFGLGLKRPLRGAFAKAIVAMNRAPGFKLAVDIPSGLSADTGEALGSSFRADCTVTFEAPKWGQILPPAWEGVGRLVVRKIGMSGTELKKIPSRAEWIDTEVASQLLPPRPRATHKGGAGRVLVVAGSREMPGAGYLSSLAALRAGAGLVTWALPEVAFRKINLRYAEVILMPLPSSGGGFGVEAIKDLRKRISTFQTLALGPGLGQGESIREFLAGLLPGLRLPRVIDADALNNLAGKKAITSALRGAAITPHWKELSRISGKSIAEIRADPIRAAAAFAGRHGCWVLLKGYRSVIASPKGKIWINSSGGPNLATAGSGDVLTGIIAGFLAQGLKLEAALICGVFLHGLAGDRLAERLGERGTIATDILKEIPRVIRDLEKTRVTP